MSIDPILYTPNLDKNVSTSDKTLPDAAQQAISSASVYYSIINCLRRLESSNVVPKMTQANNWVIDNKYLKDWSTSLDGSFNLDITRTHKFMTDVVLS